MGKSEAVRLFFRQARRQIRSIVSLCEKFGYRSAVEKESTGTIFRTKSNKHINNKIGLIVDSDCDGFTSATIIYLYLKIVNHHFYTTNYTVIVKKDSLHKSDFNVKYTKYGNR